MEEQEQPHLPRPEREGLLEDELGEVLAASPIVAGIGASAGGLKAFQGFFEALSVDLGVAYVVVTHLSAERESHLAEILASYTRMPVAQVTERVALERDHVYVIPPGKRISATDGFLSVTDIEASRIERAPIDHFFRSLAREHGDGFALVFSGGGADGSAGIRDIKEQGGLVLVQAPEEAEFDGMPRSAIATGAVDAVMPVRELAQRLGEYVRVKRSLMQIVEAVPPEEGDALHRILAYVRVRTGHDFSRYKRATLLRRIARRMQINRVERMQDYLTLLRASAEEAKALLDDFLISVTSFFRDPDAFAALKARVIPQLCEGKGAAEMVRVWVPGCATGEEAYSLAMLLLEHVATFEDPPRLQIFATDLDEGAIATAREGLYPKSIEADVSAERLHRFFHEEGGHYRVKKEVQEVILFALHSVLRDPPFSRLDLISCRNLLIYLEREVQQQVFAIFHYALQPGAYLLLGSSESIEGNTSLFRFLDKKHRLFQAREQPREAPRLPDFPLTVSVRQRLPAAPSKAAKVAQSEEAHRALLEDYAPPSIVVEEDHGVVHLSETAGAYLVHPGGSLTSDITRLVRPELRLELRSALFSAFKKGQTTFSRPLPVRFDGETRQIQLLVRPGAKRKGGEHLVLVIFIEHEAAAGEEGPSDGAPVSSAMARQLEDELRHTHDRMQALVEEYETATEELKAANEELQSMNEEYRSTAEELETSKEELQSMNEELSTVNAELKSKLEEISRAHSDLQNLISTTEIGTLFLDPDLRIHRFTPRIADLFNIMPADRGRPITHLTHHLEYPDLEADARRVIDDLIPVEREVRHASGHWYLVRLRPYRTLENRIEGVVITFVDITERRRNELALEERSQQLALAQYAGKAGAWVLDVNAGQAVWSEAGLDLLGYPPAAPPEHFDALAARVHPEDWARFRAAYEAACESEHELDVEFRIQHPESSERWLLARGRLFDPVSAQGPRLLGFVIDITERKYAEAEREQLVQALALERSRLQEANEELEARVNERTAQVQNLASRLTMAEQQERRRVSLILHDDLQQVLFSVRMKLGVVDQHAEASAAPALREEVARMNEWLEHAMGITRRLTIELSPPVLAGEGIYETLAWLATHMQEVHGLRVMVKEMAPAKTLDANMRVLLFQVTRELLFNVVKHAGVKEARVELDADGQDTLLRVIDGGAGMDVAQVLQGARQGIGLLNIRERLGLFMGTLTVDSAPGEGTRVTVRLRTSLASPAEAARTGDAPTRRKKKP